MRSAEPVSGESGADNAAGEHGRPSQVALGGASKLGLRHAHNQRCVCLRDVHRYTDAVKNIQVPRLNDAHLGLKGHAQSTDEWGLWGWTGRHALRWTHEDGIEPLVSSLTSPIYSTTPCSPSSSLPCLLALPEKCRTCCTLPGGLFLWISSWSASSPPAGISSKFTFSMSPTLTPLFKIATHPFAF